MSLVSNMLVPFTILLILINATLVGFTFIPSNIDSTDTYDFGISDADILGFVSDLNGIEADATGIIDLNAEGVTASADQINTMNILDQIWLGIGQGIDTIVQPIEGGISVITNLIKYLTFLVFGYFFWIDYFLAPLVAISGTGQLFFFIGSGLKGLFFIIQLVGLSAIILPIFSGGRRAG